MKTLKTKLPAVKRTLSVVCLSLLYHTTMYAQDSFNAQSKLRDVKTQLTNVVGNIIDIASIFAGIVGVILLVWNFFKRGKGDGQSNDALASVAWSMLFVVIGIQIVKVLFLE